MLLKENEGFKIYEDKILTARKEIQHSRPGMTLSDSIYSTCVIDTFVAVPDAQYIEVMSK